MKQYLDLLQEIIDNGRRREDRTGTGTISIFDTRIKFDLSKGDFPLLTTKFVSRRNIFEEYKGILKGELHLDSLAEAGIKFWDPWRLKADEVVQKKLPNWARLIWLEKNNPEAKIQWVKDRIESLPIEEGHKWLDDKGVPRTEEIITHQKGDLNAPYGPGWRSFGDPHSGRRVDQVQYALDLLKNNPDSRRILISAWNPLWMPEETVKVPYTNEEMWALLEERDPVLFKTFWGRLDDHGKTDNCEEFLASHGIPRTRVVKLSPQDNIIRGNPCLTACHWSVEFYSEEMTLSERLTWCSNAADPYFQDLWEDHLTALYCEENLSAEIMTPEQKTNWLTKKGVPTRWLSLKWHQRSADCVTGIPYNQGFYAFMLLSFAKEVGMAAHTLVGDLTNAHIYLNQLEEAKLQLQREPYEVVKCFIDRESTESKDIFELELSDFIFTEYKHHPAIPLKVSV